MQGEEGKHETWQIGKGKAKDEDRRKMHIADVLIKNPHHHADRGNTRKRSNEIAIRKSPPTINQKIERKYNSNKYSKDEGGKKRKDSARCSMLFCIFFVRSFFLLLFGGSSNTFSLSSSRVVCG